MQHGEAAHAAGDTGGLDTFQQLLEGNELGARPPSKQRQLGEADSDDAGDSDDDSGGDGVEGRLQAVLEEAASDEEVDLYAAMNSDEEGQAGALASGAPNVLQSSIFTGHAYVSSCSVDIMQYPSLSSLAA